MHRIFIVLAGALLVACSAQPAAPAAQPQSSPQPVSATATDLPTQAATPQPTSTAAPTQTSTPPATRWFWAVSGNEILAFNPDGQVNPVLDTSGIEQNGNDNPPIRVSDDRAIVFFANNDHPQAFLLTSDSATAIDVPEVHAPVPENGWIVVAQQPPYLVLGTTGTVTTPAILINGETGKASLVAMDVYGPAEGSYFLHFSADGSSLRFAAGEGPVKVHELNLQTGDETILFESSRSLVSDPTGEVWYDVTKGAGITADGSPVPDLKTDDNTSHLLLDGGRILAVQRDCDSPCALQLSLAADRASAFDYSLPVPLTAGLTTVKFAKPLTQNRLLVGVTNDNIADYYPTLWLLSPDGTSERLGRRIDASQAYGVPGLSADGRYLVTYSPDDTSAFTLYDLTNDQALFSTSTGIPDVYLNSTYFPEGVVILGQDTATQQWSYNFNSASGVEVPSPGGDQYCTALSPDGRLICMTGAGVEMVDPISGERKPLIEEPVSNLSD